MNRTVIGSFIGLILGAVGGFIGGCFYAKNKYLNMAEQEIESVRKVYEKHFGKQTDIKEPEKDNPLIVNKKPEDSDLHKKYIKYAGMYSGGGENPKVNTTIKSPEKPKTPDISRKIPYVITPDEYMQSENKSETLIWYSDKILADEDGNVIHNINEKIGPEALNTFGRYLDDTVYVRDDENKVDYEIIWDPRKFSSLKASLEEHIGEEKSEDEELTD